MTSHFDIMLALAEAIRTDADLTNCCIEHFGRGLDIHVGAYANGIPEAQHSPFCWICADETENDGIAADHVFSVRVVIAGCIKGEDGETYIEDRQYERTATANGLIVNGGAAIIDALRDKIVHIIAASLVGAIPNAIRREEQSISHLPLEWAVVTVDYMEPTDISEYAN